MRNDDRDDERQQAEQVHEQDPFSRRRMLLASPLSIEEERIIHQVIGSAISVHRALGPGFFESVYRNAICIELDKRHLRYERERPIKVMYDGIPISGQRIDLIVGGLVIVELKAVSGSEELHRAQLISYLRATGLRGGLLINFRVRVLRDGLRRIVLT